jgi:hypothetical protein
MACPITMLLESPLMRIAPFENPLTSTCRIHLRLLLRATWIDVEESANIPGGNVLDMQAADVASHAEAAVTRVPKRDILESEMVCPVRRRKISEPA